MPGVDRRNFGTQSGEITFDGDWCKCTCGNEPDAEGFYACTQSGRLREPTKGWGGHYRCDRCGAVGKPKEVAK